jgi:hypothetical protein
VCADEECDCQKGHQGNDYLCHWATPKEVLRLVQRKKMSSPGLLTDIDKMIDDFIEWASNLKDKVHRLTEAIGLT